MALPHAEITPIPVGSPFPAAAPSLWNERYSEIDENFQAVDENFQELSETIQSDMIALLVALGG